MITFSSLALAGAVGILPQLGAHDARDIATGREIPSRAYADQPYVVVTGEGEWVCVLTTGLGREGSEGQHVVATRSTDQGRSWSELVEVEPPSGPPASWAVPVLTGFGRIYAFYTFNGDRVHLGRDDTHGWYCYRYSDDSGRTWSERHRLPLRRTACDQLEVDGQLVQMFWGICKPFAVGDAVYFSFTKLGRYFLGDSEGWLFRSPNLLTERDPQALQFELLPEGEHGIRHPDFGSVQEEHNLAALSDGSLLCVYRTTLGHPATSISRDGGRTFSVPEPMRYSPGGRVVRNPRACPKIWRCESGRFLFWFHHHGGKDFQGRNPVWITGGVEREGAVHWAEPEILLYSDDRSRRMSYPCLIEDGGRTFVTETDKETARVHCIDPGLLEGLWGQFENRSVTRDGLILELREEEMARAGAGGAEMPEIPDLARRGGFSVEMWLRLDSLREGQRLFDSRADGSSRGIVIQTAANTLEIRFSDGVKSGHWDADPGLLKPGTLHHVVFTVDAGPHVVTVLVDGKLCDGAIAGRQHGWGRFDPEIGDVTGGPQLTLPAPPAACLTSLRIYNRPLRTSEAVANFNHTRSSSSP